jgi:Na+:H+ antiporter, NhaC family
MSGVLGVSTVGYLPYCFFNLLSPILDVVYGFLGFKVATTDEVAARQAQAEAPAAAQATHISNGGSEQ